MFLIFIVIFWSLQKLKLKNSLNSSCWKIPQKQFFKSVQAKPTFLNKPNVQNTNLVSKILQNLSWRHQNLGLKTISNTFFDSESPNFFTKCTFSIYIYNLYIRHFYFQFSAIFHVTAFTRNNKQGKFKWQQSSLDKIFIKKNVLFEFSWFFLKCDKNQQSILVKNSFNCHFHKYLPNKIKVIQQNSRHQDLSRQIYTYKLRVSGVLKFVSAVIKVKYSIKYLYRWSSLYDSQVFPTLVNTFQFIWDFTALQHIQD